MGDFLTVTGILVALIVGGIGILQSYKANHAAERALMAASKATETGEEALGIAKRTESRSTEVSNIHWEGHWAGIGVYRLVNKGDDDAHDVRVVLTVDEVETRGSAALVSGRGGFIDLEVPEVVGKYISERRQYERWEKERSRPSGIGFPLTKPMPPQFYHSLRERVDWSTGSGTPARHDESWNLSDIGPEY